MAAERESDGVAALRAAARGKNLPGVERARAEPPSLLSPDTVRALTAVPMAGLVVGAAILRTRLTADLPFDLLALLLRATAVAFSVRALLAVGVVFWQRARWARGGGEALSFSDAGIFEVTRKGERFMSRQEVLDVRVREEPGRSPAERATFLIARPQGAIAYWELSGRYAETADILAARLLRWLGQAKGSEPPTPRDEPPEERYRRAAAGKPDPGDLVVPEGHGYVRRAPYAALLGAVFAVDAVVSAGPLRARVLPVAGIACVLAVAFVCAWLLWMGRRRASRLGIALLIAPEELLVRGPGGVVSLPHGQLASVEVVPRLAWSPFWGSFAARSLVVTAHDGARLVFDAGFLGVPVEVVAALLDGYRTGRAQASS